MCTHGYHTLPGLPSILFIVNATGILSEVLLSGCGLAVLGMSRRIVEWSCQCLIVTRQRRYEERVKRSR